MMNEEEIAHFRTLLEARREELRERLAKGREVSNPVAPDRAIGRLTRQEALQAQQVSLELQRNLKLQLQQVEQALKRIDNGSFGECVGCGEEIARTRLQARPEAHLCIRCAERVAGR